MKRLVIEHNHGAYVLEDVELVPYGEARYDCRTAKGTVIEGGVANRLFSATSYTPETKGAIKEVDIWNRSCYCTDKQLDHWRCSIVLC